jgi:hypothetical protein
MKKELMMVAVALMTAMGMQAQSDGFSRHEVAVSYGACSNSQWINILEEVTVVGFTLEQQNTKTRSISEPFLPNISIIPMLCWVLVVFWLMVRTNKMSITRRVVPRHQRVS